MRLASIALAVLAGTCALPNTGPQPMANSNRDALHAADSEAYLYVAGLSALTVYPLDGTKPIRSVSNGYGIAGMAVDRWNDIYVTTGDPSGYYGIFAYTAGAKSALLQLPYFAAAIAFDMRGRLYGLDTEVFEVAARGNRILRQFDKTSQIGRALAFDRAGNLYVDRDSEESSGPDSITVFRPGSRYPSRQITAGLNAPYALVVDRAYDLYVANCPTCWSRSSSAAGSVVEYAKGKSKPFRSITEGIDNPMALALSTDGLLFVANAPTGKTGWVSVYANGKLLRIVSRDIHAPVALAVDATSGDLYVANCNCWSHRYGSVTVYDKHGSRLLRTITRAGEAPTAIAIGGP